MEVEEITLRYKCDCGWSRAYHNDRTKYHIIDHPLYGKLRNIDLVTTDIAKHDCKAYLQAKYIIHGLQQTWSARENYRRPPPQSDADSGTGDDHPRESQAVPRTKQDEPVEADDR